jgi:hypothetical protein
MSFVHLPPAYDRAGRAALAMWSIMLGAVVLLLFLAMIG